MAFSQMCLALQQSAHYMLPESHCGTAQLRGAGVTEEPRMEPSAHQSIPSRSNLLSISILLTLVLGISDTKASGFSSGTANVLMRLSAMSCRRIPFGRIRLATYRGVFRNCIDFHAQCTSLVALCGRKQSLVVESSHQNVLHLDILFNSVIAAFPAIPRMLDAPERNGCGAHGARIQYDHTGLDRTAQALRAAMRTCEYVGHKTVLRAVGPIHDLVFVAEPVDRKHRTENFGA